MVQNVECLRSKLQVHGLREVETFVDSEVLSPEARRTEGVTSQIRHRRIAGDDVAIVRTRRCVPDAGIESERSIVVHIASVSGLGAIG